MKFPSENSKNTPKTEVSLQRIRRQISSSSFPANVIAIKAQTAYSIRECRCIPTQVIEPVKLLIRLFPILNLKLV